MTPQPHTPRYRVTVHELHNGHQTKIMDATASGFIAATATIQNGDMDITLGDGGAHELKAHIALFISHQYRD